MKRAAVPVLLLVLVGATACADDEPARGFDRESERRAVMCAVLTKEYRRTEEEHGKATQRFVLDPELTEGPRFPSKRAIARMQARGRELPAAVQLPSGRRVRAPTIEGLDPDLIADWAAHAGPSPTPTSLDLPLPIDWFTGADWDALKGVVVTGGFDSPKWQAFHVKHPGSTGSIDLSNVGFSARGDQALIYVSASSGSLSGAGLWYLLEKQDGGWTIIEKEVVWVS